MPEAFILNSNNHQQSMTLTLLSWSSCTQPGWRSCSRSSPTSPPRSSPRSLAMALLRWERHEIDPLDLFWPSGWAFNSIVKINIWQEDSQEWLSLISDVNRYGGTNWTWRLAIGKSETFQAKFFHFIHTINFHFFQSCLTVTGKVNSKLSLKPSAALWKLHYFFVFIC